MFDKKTRKKFTILCLMYGDLTGSTLNWKFLTGFFVGSQTFTSDCSSLEIFFEILKTSRHKQLAFLWRNVLRIFNGFLSGQRGRVKVRGPPQFFYFAQRYSSNNTNQNYKQQIYVFGEKKFFSFKKLFFFQQAYHPPKSYRWLHHM